MLLITELGFFPPLIPLVVPLWALCHFIFMKSLKFSDPGFPVEDYISFTNAPTKSASTAKLTSNSSTTSLSCHTYFCRLVRIWNALPPIDLSLSYSTINPNSKSFSRIIFFLVLILLCLVLSIYVICPCNRCSQVPVKVCFTNIVTQMFTVFIFNWVSMNSFDFPSVHAVYIQ